MHRDLELAARQFLDLLGKHFGRAINGVQRLGKAGGQAPAHGGLGMHGGCGTRGQHTGDARVFDDGTTIHWFSPNCVDDPQAPSPWDASACDEEPGL
jgi:hypothetical protein